MSNAQNSSFLPPSLDSDSIADTIKSFFPMGGSSTPHNSNSSAMQFHQSFSPTDFLSRSSNQTQDLRLSLQSFKDPMLHHHHHHQQTEEGNSMFLDGSGWPERMVGWGGGASGGFPFSSPPTQTTPFLQNDLFNNNSQRGPLQSSNTSSVRAWIDQPPFVGAAAVDHPSSMSGFTSGVGGFSGYLIPARIEGEQEEDDGISDKPSSASSDSRH
uniref:Uncharacterized protein n=2 Tax=Lactuca sativa TaxID=4236 RepID=A0A9R1WT58_LACSA|nr:hypothetical protein LSAT_V11C900495930 [Lactuca sativa]